MMRIALLLALLCGTTLAGAQGLTGPYVGGYLAGGSADAHWDISSGTKVDNSLSGALVGVQGGYNWNPRGLLLGVQADLGVGNLSGSSRCPNPAFECKTELLSMLTIRGRVGPAFGNVAPYVTAGIASAARYAQPTPITPVRVVIISVPDTTMTVATQRITTIRVSLR